MVNAVERFSVVSEQDEKIFVGTPITVKLLIKLKEVSGHLPTPDKTLLGVVK